MVGGKSIKTLSRFHWDFNIDAVPKLKLYCGGWGWCVGFLDYYVNSLTQLFKLNNEVNKKRPCIVNIFVLFIKPVHTF